MMRLLALAAFGLTVAALPATSLADPSHHNSGGWGTSSPARADNDRGGGFHDIDDEIGMIGDGDCDADDGVGWFNDHGRWHHRHHSHGHHGCHGHPHSP